jgi:dihydrofolate synthase/folylpolyglutamate synthase
MTPSNWSPARARAWLEDLQRRGTLLGLERVEAIADRLGHPEHAFPAVLVAGTSGKGSVTALVESMLRAGGRKTGRYTSPHLIDWPERITVAGLPIGEEELAHALGAVAEEVERVEATPFEALTIAAFLHFRSEQVEMAVVEVGLGGRLDATRICRAEVTAVTAIGVDHVAELGADPAGIAREKGAIARPGAPMVLGPDSQPVREVLEAQLAGIGAETVWAADRVGLEAVEDGWGWRGRASWRGPAAEAARRQGEEAAFDWSLPLAGEHMLRNLTTALAVVSCLRQRGWTMPTSALEKGIAAVTWPGRLQLVAPPPGRPALLLEVGHNTLAARAVAAHLARRPRPHRRLVMAIARDKDAAGVLDILLPGTEELVATTWGGPRALEPEELARLALQRARSAGRELPVETAPDPVAAVARAGRGLRDDGLIVALGSHLLVGPLLAALRRPDAHSLLWP